METCVDDLSRALTYVCRWSWRRDLNPRPADYKSAALPTELRQPEQKANFSTSRATRASNRAHLLRLSLPRFPLVAAELFEVAEREHRVGVPVRNCSGIGRVKGSRAATTLVLTALQAIERLDLLMFAVVLHPVVREPALCLGCPAFRAGRRWRWPFGQATRAGRAAPGRRRSAVSVRGASARPSVAAFQRTTAGAPTSMGGLWALIE